ncbi:MAG: VTT domain-containing protein [Candidatus Doudnabacteria bacterium]
MFNLVELIQAVGYLGLFAIIFAETGLLIGFFLPGDSLLFTAGILAAEGYLNIWLLLLILYSAAIIGNQTGFRIGKKFGPRVFSKEESLLFSQKNIQRTEDFFAKHGSLTIILARFVPIMRTFVPVMAGVGNMSEKKFLVQNIAGATLWIFTVTLLGYFLGLKVENIEAYILPIAIVIIFISILPYLKQFISNPEMRRETWHYINRIWNRINPYK